MPDEAPKQAIAGLKPRAILDHRHAVMYENSISGSGGVGGILALAHEWADTAATRRSYELFARYVMPHFQGQLDPCCPTATGSRAT